MATVDEINAQMTALRQQINQLSGATGIGAASQLNQLTAQYNNLLNQKNRVRQQGATGSGQTAQQQAEAARDKIMQTAQGSIDRLKNDPTDQMLRQYLQTQMGAQVLDPNAKPFQNGAPQYTAQGMQAQGVDAQRGQAFTYNPASASAAQTQAFTYNPTQSQVGQMDAATVDYQDPFNGQVIQAMVNEQAAGAGAAESARNQLIRDAALANGGNAFDPSLAASQAESMSQRNRAVANARNQINIVANRENAATRNAAQLANAGFKQQAGQFNVGSANQNNQFNAGLMNQAGQFNAGAQQNAASQNAGFQQQANLYNAGAQNAAGQFNAGNQQNASFQNAGMAQQAGMFNAGAQNQASAFNAGAQNQAGMFNAGNQMQAGLANFNAGTQAQMYNQGQRTGAAQSLGSYNNQRQGMLYDAEGRLINVVGNQVFRSPETPMRMPSFQQFSGGGGGASNVTYAPGYFQPMINQNLGWAPSRPTVTRPPAQGGGGSGGAPWANAMVGLNQPAVNRPPQKPSNGVGSWGWGAFQQAFQNASQNATPKPGLAPQIMKPVNPNDYNPLG